jgi:hypothetical protein
MGERIPQGTEGWPLEDGEDGLRRLRACGDQIYPAVAACIRIEALLVLTHSHRIEPCSWIKCKILYTISNFITKCEHIIPK